MTEVDPLDSGVCDWVFDGRLKDQGWKDEDLPRLARVLARRCPECGAQPGEWCQTRTKRLIMRMDDLHVRRRIPNPDLRQD